MPTAAHLHTLSVQLSFQQYSHKWLYTAIQPTYNLAMLSLSVYTQEPNGQACITTSFETSWRQEVYCSCHIL